MNFLHLLLYLKGFFLYGPYEAYPSPMSFDDCRVMCRDRNAAVLDESSSYSGNDIVWMRSSDPYACWVHSEGNIIEDSCAALHICVCERINNVLSDSLVRITSLRSRNKPKSRHLSDYDYAYDDSMDDYADDGGGDQTSTVVGGVVISVSVITVLLGCCVLYRRYKNTQIYSESSAVFAQAQVPQCPHGMYIEQKLQESDELFVPCNCTLTDCIAVPTTTHCEEMQDIEDSA